MKYCWVRVFCLQVSCLMSLSLSSLCLNWTKKDSFCVSYSNTMKIAGLTNKPQASVKTLRVLSFIIFASLCVTSIKAHKNDDISSSLSTPLSAFSGAGSLFTRRTEGIQAQDSSPLRDESDVERELSETVIAPAPSATPSASPSTSLPTTGPTGTCNVSYDGVRASFCLFHPLSLIAIIISSLLF